MRSLKRKWPVLRQNLVRLGGRTFAIRLEDSNTARVGGGGGARRLEVIDASARVLRGKDPPGWGGFVAVMPFASCPSPLPHPADIATVRDGNWRPRESSRWEKWRVARGGGATRARRGAAMPPAGRVDVAMLQASDFADSDSCPSPKPRPTRLADPSRSRELQHGEDWWGGVSTCGRDRVVGRSTAGL
jgi:hypothetical protein